MSVASPSRAAFPGSQAGRHPRLHFRGLLRLHSNYGPLDRSTAQGGLCHRASIHPVTRTNRLPATRSNRQLSGWFLPPLVIRAFWAHVEFEERRGGLGAVTGIHSRFCLSPLGGWFRVTGRADFPASGFPTKRPDHLARHTAVVPRWTRLRRCSSSWRLDDPVRGDGGLKPGDGHLRMAPGPGSPGPTRRGLLRLIPTSRTSGTTAWGCRSTPWSTGASSAVGACGVVAIRLLADVLALRE